jgi:hypothetical protein
MTPAVARHSKQREADRHDAALAHVQHGERLEALDVGVLELAQALVEALGLEALVAEVLHRLVVEQRVDRARVGLGVGVARVAVVAQPPLGHRERVRDVGRERAERDQAKPRS